MNVRSFWQSPVVAAEINRRITGDAGLSPATYFARVYCRRAREHALSIGCGDTTVERDLLIMGACREMVAVDVSPERLEQARADMPPGLAPRLELVRADIETWRPPARFDLIVSNGVLSRLERLEDVLNTLKDALTYDGVLYINEFVGPSRFQWTDKQIEIINRLLARISPELREDVVSPERGVRSAVTRRPIPALIAADSKDAVRSAEIPDLLNARFEAVEERRWGGAIFHQLFNRIMGNFASHDDLVRVVMEVDAILTDEGVVGSDYLWGVYKLARDRPVLGRSEPRADGRLDSVEDGTVVGWAVDRSDLDDRLGVDMFVDHKLVGKAVADLPRADLVREGIGDGAHAFQVELPSWVRDGREHAISLVTPALGATLPAARGWGLSRTLPCGTKLTWARHDPSLPPLPAARVLAGPDGWAFGCDDAVGSIEQLLGRLTLTKPDLRQWRALLDRRARALASLGIRYVVAVAPAKAAVHPERLPSSSPALAPPQLAGQLRRTLAGAEPTVVDLLPTLADAARSGHQLYYKGDLGWNYEGASLAAGRLIAAVHQGGVGAAELDPDEIRWNQETFVGALAGRPAVALEDGRLRPVPTTTASEISRYPDEQRLGLRRISTPEHLSGRDPEVRIVECHARGDRPTAVVLHDQGGLHLEPFVAAVFGRSVWIPGRTLDPELIEAERPAVVLHVLDESLLVRVPYELEG